MLSDFYKGREIEFVMLPLYVFVLVLVVVSDSDGQTSGLGYQFPKGEYINKRLTGNLISKIKDDLGKEATGVLLQAAYTAWCSGESSDTITSYQLTSGFISDVVAGKAEDLYSYIHTPGRFEECWGESGYEQTMTVSHDFVSFYQGLALLYNEATGVIPLASNVYQTVSQCEDQ